MKITKDSSIGSKTKEKDKMLYSDGKSVYE